jgi:hypothetical protein
LGAWSLYVDESGTFCGERDVVPQRVVAGVLVRDETAAAHEKRLRQALETVAPWIPWPFHANLLRRPVCHALWTLTWPNPSKRGLQKADAAVRAAKQLEALAPAETRALAERLRRVPKVAHERLAALARLLNAHDQATLQALGNLAGEVRAKVTDALARLTAGVTAPEIVLAVAGESAVDETPASALPGRYLPLLELLLERIADTLSALGRETGDARHRVELHILGRDVEDSAHAEDLPLNVGHVDQVVDQVTGGGLERSAGGVTVEFVIHAPHPFDAETLPHLVVADFAANAARGPLADPRGLDWVRPRIEGAVGLPTVLGSATPTTGLAGGGEARRRVDLAREGQQVTGQPAGRLWAFEQAALWCEVVSGWNGGAP